MRVGTMLAAAVLLAGGPVHAGIVSDWNDLQSKIDRDSDNAAASFNPKRMKAGSELAIAMFEAANAVTPAYVSYVGLPRAAAGASDAAAVATAAHEAMLALYPDDKGRIDTLYTLEMMTIPVGAGRDAGVSAGKAAAAAALKVGVYDPSLPRLGYRPVGIPGKWAPSNVPFPAELLQAKPYVLKSPDELRLGPPPAITSALFAASFNETKTMGSKTSTARTPEQTMIARFFVDYSLDPLIRQIDSRPGKRLVDNAHLVAALAVALDDLTFVLAEGKMHWMSWRPLNAIRTASDDGNPATDEDVTWEPLLRTPYQPEYPCGHCGVAGTVAGIVAPEMPTPPGGYAFSSDSLAGATLHFDSLADYAQTASDSRIWGGVHFRHTNQPSIVMGGALAKLVRERFAPPLQ